MLFKLNEPVDDTLEFNGVTYSLDMSFDNVLDVFDILEDNALAVEERLYIALSFLIDDEAADKLNLGEMLEIFRLIQAEHINMENPNQVYDLLGNPIVKKEKPVFSLTQDAEFIYTSFIFAYGIDLHDQFGKMHWQKFRLLLRDLPAESKFKKVIDIREWKPSKGTSSEEKAKMRELQKMYELKDIEDEEGGDE